MHQEQVKIKKRYYRLTNEQLILSSIGELPKWEEEFLALLLVKRIPDNDEFQALVDRLIPD